MRVHHLNNVNRAIQVLDQECGVCDMQYFCTPGIPGYFTITVIMTYLYSATYKIGQQR